MNAPCCTNGLRRVQTVVKATEQTPPQYNNKMALFLPYWPYSLFKKLDVLTKKASLQVNYLAT